MSQPNTLHPQAYCYYIELTGSERPDLLTALTTSEQELGDWEPVQAAKLPTWRLWTDANADTIRYTVAHVIARTLCRKTLIGYCSTRVLTMVTPECCTHNFIPVNKRRTR